MIHTIEPVKTKAGTNYLTEDEERKLFKTISNRKDDQATRDFYLLKIARATALRRGEILSLNVGDVREKTRLVVDSRIAKKGGTGSLWLSLETQKLIREFLFWKRKNKEPLEDESPLFISKKGYRLAERTFNDIMTKWCKEAGIPRFTPHALRHTKAQRIMADIWQLNENQRNKKLQLVQNQLRQRALSSTIIYTAPTKEDMQTVANI